VSLTARAPGKVNLCLYLGPVRPDGRHELVTVFESVSLADVVTVEVTAALTAAPAGPAALTAAPAGPPADEVVCAGVDGLNIVTQTLDGLRARGWDAPPVRVVIEKRIPVAGGMGGGSADAAAVLRLAPCLAPVAAEDVLELAVSLGADVPSQLRPGLTLGTGAGDQVELLEPLRPHAFVIVPQAFGLSTADVYGEADRLGLPRSGSVLAARARELRGDASIVYVNDLEPAALSLRPDVGVALAAVRDTGADHAMVSGSGPTVFGVYLGEDAAGRAEAAAVRLSDRYPGATSAAPVREEFAVPRGS
jgi:4-diphosphocytidyl-2-C-methyl-D-erythritol kinase